MKKIFAFFRDGVAEEWIGRVAISVIIVPVVLNIFNRLLFKEYSSVLEDLALIAFVWIGYAGFGYHYKKDSHVDVRFVENLLPVRGQEIFEFFRDLYIFAFSAVMVVWGIRLSKNGLVNRLPGSRLLYIYADLAVVFGFVSGALRSGYSVIQRICSLFRKKEVRE